MTRQYTQSECRAMWEQVFHSEKGPTIEEIDYIDSLTPWSNIEPNWWLDMMRERRALMEKKP